ncbi:hypothetical protein SNE40_018957 [Patella caerulea]|uniref:Fringe-like glycosyltransferase domain-containing protein n=1 Tax=Patella caerulea TaxID=87958 RepID=A0AAN8J5X7_PATCE
MRVSLRRAAKFTAIVIVVIFTNFLISYEVSQKLDDRRSERGDTEDRVNNGRAEVQVDTASLGEPVDIRQKDQKINLGRNRDSELRRMMLAKERNNLTTSNNVRITANGLDQKSVSSGDKNRKTELSDIFISVKTTQRNHKSRLRILLDTWILLARDQTHIFTDADDPEISHDKGVHVVNTNCLPTHSRQALCCKMAIEYDSFLESKKRWFCHVDDDTYVNIPQLVKLVKKYDHTQDWYLGKPSLARPIEMIDRKHKGQKIAFWFATGGAGFCISRSLALKMMPHASGGRFMTVGETIRLPDDCTIGYIISHLLKKELTIVNEFHSHLESLKIVKSKDMENQITYSYNKANVVHVSGFTDENDPSRIRSLHCFLFPTFRECKDIDSNS